MSWDAHGEKEDDDDDDDDTLPPRGNSSSFSSHSLSSSSPLSVSIPPFPSRIESSKVLEPNAQLRFSPHSCSLFAVIFARSLSTDRAHPSLEASPRGSTIESNYCKLRSFCDYTHRCRPARRLDHPNELICGETKDDLNRSQRFLAIELGLEVPEDAAPRRVAWSLKE